MLPVNYVPKHEIVTFGGDRYLIDSDKRELFAKEMEQNKFVRIGDSHIAVSSIEKVTPAKQEISIVESLIVEESEEIKAKVRQKVRQRDAEGLQNTEGVIRNIIESYS